MKKIAIVVMMAVLAFDVYAQNANSGKNDPSQAHKAVVSVLNNNKLYRGIENRVAMAVYGLEMNEVEMSVQGSKAKLAQDKAGSCNYIVIPAHDCDQVVLMIREKKTGRLVSNVSYPCADAPLPMVTLGKHPCFSTVKLDELSGMPVCANDPLGISACQVERCTFQLLGNGRPAIELKDGKISDECVEAVAAEVKNDARRPNPQGVQILIQAVVRANGMTHSISSLFTITL